MTQSFVGTITCDECGESQGFEVSRLRDLEGELWIKAEDVGWEIGTDDLCVRCVIKREAIEQN